MMPQHYTLSGAGTCVDMHQWFVPCPFPPILYWAMNMLHVTLIQKEDVIEGP